MTAWVVTKVAPANGVRSGGPAGGQSRRGEGGGSPAGQLRLKAQARRSLGHGLFSTDSAAAPRWWGDPRP